MSPAETDSGSTKALLPPTSLVTGDIFKINPSGILVFGGIEIPVEVNGSTKETSEESIK